MKKVILLAFIAIIFASCEALQFKPEDPIKGAGAITLKFIQMNDVYEIAPIGNGQYGGLARVAHIRDSIKEQFPNTFLFLAGDFLSPSVLGSLTLDGAKISGKQMIEVLNAMNLDAATFGNHEFDLSETELSDRINESNFTWTTANVRRVTAEGLVPFSKQLQYSSVPTSDFATFNATDTDGNKIKFGVFGVTLPSNPKPYVAYGDIYKEAEKSYNLAIDKADFVVGLTHVTIEEDKKIAAMFSELPLIMGGHEHNNMLERVGNTLITKADANARTIYIHTVIYNLRTQQLNVASELMDVTDKIATSAKVDLVVNKWTSILDGIMKEEQLAVQADIDKAALDNGSKKKSKNNAKKKLPKKDVVKTSGVEVSANNKSNESTKNSKIIESEKAKPKIEVVNTTVVAITDSKLPIAKQEKNITSKQKDKVEPKTNNAKSEVVRSNKTNPAAVEEKAVLKEITNPAELKSEVVKTTEVTVSESKLPVAKAEKIESKVKDVKHEVIISNKTIPAVVEEKIVSTETKKIVEKTTETSKTAETSLLKLIEPLNGSDKANRSEQTNLGTMIAKSMAFVYDGKVDGSIVNGGSIRIDEQLTGNLTRTDIYRTLPFGGSVLKVELMGSLLRKILAFGEEQSGTGAYLQLDNLSKTANGYWKNGEKVINDRKIYTIAISDYLLKGLDIPFLVPSNPDIVKIYTPTESENASDIRKAIIFYLNSLKN